MTPFSAKIITLAGICVRMSRVCCSWRCISPCYRNSFMTRVSSSRRINPMNTRSGRKMMKKSKNVSVKRVRLAVLTNEIRQPEVERSQRYQ